ncbi:hypothetical protein P7C71_g5239, partial [Lecanoromycetidae sp. Uapishka_2]
MRGLKPIALLGIGSIAAAESNSACNGPFSPSTIYLTVPGSPVTETVYAVTLGPSPVVGEAASGNAIITTVTSSFISTQYVNVIQATSNAGAYSFTEENGTTSWLGQTPPASAVLVTATSYITLQPIITSSPIVSEGAFSQSTTHLTLYSTETITETSTMTVTESSLAFSSAAGAYTGLKSNGWNATMTTLTKVKATATGTVTIQPSPYQPAFKAVQDAAAKDSGAFKPSLNVPALKAEVEEKAASFSGTAYALSTFSVGAYPWDPSPGLSLSAGDMTLSLVPQSSTLFSESSLVQSAAGSTNAAMPSISAQATSSVTWFNTSSPTSTTSATCGENTPGFIIDFDDLPHFSIGDDPAESDIPPIFNPYRKLYFQDHFGYVPPPSDPYPPISPPQLAIYRVAGIDVTGSPDAGLLQFGEIGSGPNSNESAYFFDAYSVWFGCANGGPEDCTITINGFVSGVDGPSVSMNVTQPPCPGLKNCSLQFIEFGGSLEFGSGFDGLDGLQFVATVGLEAVDYYMDNLMLAWSNNTCAAQQERSLSE